MNDERCQFGRLINPTGAKGEFDIINSGTGKTVNRFKNPVKEVRISIDLLENLRSLAIMAEADPTNSADQEWLGKELDNLKKKFPAEQPQEVWRRTLATLMGQGVDMESVAEKLITTDNQHYIKQNLGAMSKTEREGRIKKLKEEILIYWPSSPNLA
jgi:hypothetical protein